MSLLSGISVLCFAGSYTLVLLLEVVRLFYRPGLRQSVVIGLTALGLLAHTLYLARRAFTASGAPLSSAFDWYLLAAWGLVVVYLYLSWYHRKTSIGLFLLPLVLVLIGLAEFASREPFPQSHAGQIWGMIHGIFLLLGLVAVTVGFVAGVMYLLQSYRLKHKLPAATGPRLPSLEWLERVNSRAILISALMVGIGFASGIVLNMISHHIKIDEVPWSDPVIWSTAAMFAWLLAAAIFSAVYRPARSGRKVAYLTVASFAFLAVSIGVRMLLPTEHGNQRDESTAHHGAGGSHMKLQMVGCSHHNASLAVRERLAFSPDQVAVALDQWRASYPMTEAVLLSTCNRVELYTAADDPRGRALRSASQTVSGRISRPAAASGVRRFVRAIRRRSRATFIHRGSQFGQHGAGRIANPGPGQSRPISSPRGKTASAPSPTMFFSAPCVWPSAWPRKRPSTTSASASPASPSAVSPKMSSSALTTSKCLVIGAGETAEEVLVYLREEGARQITVINRTQQTAAKLAQDFGGQTAPWNELDAKLAAADLIVSATGASQPVVTLEHFRRIEPQRYQRPLFILDLAVPRDFEPAIGDRLGVYLYSLDDLQEVCRRNRAARDQEMPQALAHCRRRNQPVYARTVSPRHRPHYSPTAPRLA